MSLELSEKALRIKPSSTMMLSEKANDLKRSGRDIISFTAGEPDFRTPETICAAGIRAIEEGKTRYTKAVGLLELREAIAEKFRRFNHLEYRPEQIVVSNGGKHSLSNAFTALLNPGDEVIIPAPYWVTYSESARLAGGVPVIVYTKKENSYKLTREELEAAWTEKTKALVLNTPNNPTGMIYSRAELAQIADFVVEHEFYVVADEVYECLCYEGAEHVSIASLNEQIYSRTVTISGVSKSYAMTGWRIGYAAAPKEIARLMSSIQSQQTSNPNTIAQYAAIEALSGSQDKVREMAAAYNERRKYICERIRGIDGLSCVEPQGAFYIFLDVNGLIGKTWNGKAAGAEGTAEAAAEQGRVLKDAAEIADILLMDYSVGTIPCADFGFPDHIRLSYSVSMEEIKIGMDRIEAFCRSVS